MLLSSLILNPNEMSKIGCCTVHLYGVCRRHRQAVLDTATSLKVLSSLMLDVVAPGGCAGSTTTLGKAGMSTLSSVTKLGQATAAIPKATYFFLT